MTRAPAASGLFQKRFPLCGGSGDARGVLALRHDVDELGPAARQGGSIRPVRFHRQRLDLDPGEPRDGEGARIRRRFHGDDVTGIGERAEEQVQPLLGAARDEDFVGRALDAVLRQPPADLQAQLLQPEGRRVLPEVGPPAPGVGQRPGEVLEREEPLVGSQP